MVGMVRMIPNDSECVVDPSPSGVGRFGRCREARQHHAPSITTGRVSVELLKSAWHHDKQDPKQPFWIWVCGFWKLTCLHQRVPKKLFWWCGKRDAFVALEALSLPLKEPGWHEITCAVLSISRADLCTCFFGTGGGGRFCKQIRPLVASGHAFCCSTC